MREVVLFAKFFDFDFFSSPSKVFPTKANLESFLHSLLFSHLYAKNHLHVLYFVHLFMKGHSIIKCIFEARLTKNICFIISREKIIIIPVYFLRQNQFITHNLIRNPKKLKKNFLP